MDLNGYIIAFVLDGTLVDTAPDIIGDVNLVLREDGGKPYHLDEGRPLIGGGAMELLRRRIADPSAASDVLVHPVKLIMRDSVARVLPSSH